MKTLIPGLALLILMTPANGCAEERSAGEKSLVATAGGAAPAAETSATAGERSGASAMREPLRLADVPAPAAAPAADPAPAPARAAPTELSAWRLTYLAKSADQARRLEKAIGRLGESRLGSAALAASALAANGREGWRPQAVVWVERALERCGGRWHRLECELALRSLQRVVLQFPEALPQPLLHRLTAAASNAAPPPGPEVMRDPWGSRLTENQQMAKMARSVVAHRVARTGGSPAARAWADHARAFLTAHDRQGWYEGESPGYMATSISSLLLLRDHAPDPRVRGLAERQLHLLFAAWAENQVDGIPAGPRTRTYTHWAQGTANTPWPAWTHYFTGGDGGVAMGSDRHLGDWPDVATSGYEMPAPVVALLRTARDGAPYEIRRRKVIDLGRRRDLAAALYSWVTPDYVLSTAPAVDGLSLAVSGGQEIQAALFAEAAQFSPLYLWTRTEAGRARDVRWRSRAGQEQVVGWRHLALGRFGGGEAGHAWLASPWSRPEPAAEASEVLVARSGETWVALVTTGGWRVQPAAEAFPDHYGGKAYQGTWVATPRRQPAVIGLQVGRASEEGSWEAWKAKAAGLEVRVGEGGEEPPAAHERGERERREPRPRPGADGPVLVFDATAPGSNRSAVAAGGEAEAETGVQAPGHRLVFRPGRTASIDGQPIEPSSWPLHVSPHLVHGEAAGEAGAWGFRAAGVDYRLPPLPDESASSSSPAAASPPASSPASPPAPDDG